MDIISCHLVDLTHVTHDRVAPEFCPLPHTKKIVDRVNHFFQEYEFMFQSVSIILIEEQPYKGVASAVEAMIFNKWRNKCHHIRPLDMLYHYGYRHYTYEQRKKISVQIAQQVLTNMGFSDMLAKFERKHDCSDAILMACFYLAKEKEKEEKLAKDEEYKNTDFAIFLEQCRYKPKS